MTIKNVVTGEENELTKEMLAILEHVGEYQSHYYEGMEKDHPSLKRKDLQKAMIILKQAGIVVFTPLTDCDGIPAGSGHILTAYGRKIQDELEEAGKIEVKIEDYSC